MENVQSKLVLVAGLPGCGKTTFSAALADEIGALHLNSDKVRIEIGKTGRYDEATKASVYEELLHRMEAGLSAGKMVIVDATFYKKELWLPFSQIAEKLKAPVYWIEIKAGEDVIRARIGQKRSFSEANFEVYLKIKVEAEPLEMERLVLWSDRLTLEEMTREAKTYLGAGEAPTEDGRTR